MFRQKTDFIFIPSLNVFTFPVVVFVTAIEVGSRNILCVCVCVEEVVRGCRVFFFAVATLRRCFAKRLSVWGTFFLPPFVLLLALCVSLR